MAVGHLAGNFKSNWHSKVILRAVIQQPTPRSFETVKVHKIELEKALRDAKGPREC